MNPAPTIRARSAPALLALLGGLVVLIAFAARVFVTRAAPDSVPAPGLVGAAVTLDQPGAGAPDEGRTPLDVRALRRTPEDPVEEPPAAQGPEPRAPLKVGSASERELLEDFLRQAAREPGVLERRAAALLAGDGPSSEKVALLRALCESGSPAALGWLEQVVHTLPDVSKPLAESVPSFAVRQLARLGSAQPEARAALLRLAFEQPGVPEGLRRRAASHFAALCEGERLWELERRLWLERDGQLRDGVLAALEARAAEAEARRLLYAFGRTPPDVPPVEVEDH